MFTFWIAARNFWLLLRNHPGGYELQMYGEALVNCISSIL